MGVHELDLEYPTQRDRRQTGRSVRWRRPALGHRPGPGPGRLGPAGAQRRRRFRPLSGRLVDDPGRRQGQGAGRRHVRRSRPEVAPRAVAHRRRARLCRVVRRVRQRRPLQLRSGADHRGDLVLRFLQAALARPGQVRPGLRTPRRCSPRVRRSPGDAALPGPPDRLHRGRGRVAAPDVRVQPAGGGAARPRTRACRPGRLSPRPIRARPQSRILRSTIPRSWSARPSWRPPTRSGSTPSRRRSPRRWRRPGWPSAAQPSVCGWSACWCWG